MSRLTRLLLITFIESLATILMERGLYFYMEDVLAFRPAARLWMGLCFGLAYVGGALASHALCRRLTEKRLLAGTITGQALAHALLIAWAWWSLGSSGSGPAAVWILSACFLAIGLFNGMKWPVLESYISAGRLPVDQSRAIGKFNMSWALAVPVALVVAGPLIDAWRPAIFTLALGLNLAALALVRPLERMPRHLEADHPERLSAERVAHYRSLLISARWTMFGTYALLFLIAPLMPTILRRLGWEIQAQTGLSAILDVMRLAAFTLFQWTAFWHGRRDVVIAAIVLSPIGFLLVILGQSTAAVVVGQVIFGFLGGAIYYAALYYGMVAKNASVDAGGAHEAMIGLGFAVGPLTGLVALSLQGPLGGEVAGTLAGVAPLLLLCLAGGLWPLLRRKRPDGKVADAAR